VAIKKAVVAITMLYDERDVPRSFFENASLEDLAHEMYSGDCIGQHKLLTIEDVPADQVETELKALGNDGTFFDYQSDEGPQP
jgi:hypothetical protein